MSLLTTVLLSPYLIFGVLALIFLVISYWSLVGLREYPGYILGCLVGLLVVFVVSAIGVKPNVEGQTVDIQTTTLTVFQALCPAIFGMLIGIAFLVIPRLADWTLPPHAQAAIPRGIKVASITALWVTLVFIFILVGIETQRMIGIFALAFMIARLFAIVMNGGSNFGDIVGSPRNTMMTAQSVDPLTAQTYDPLTGDPMSPLAPPTGGPGFSRLDAIRSRMVQRNPPRQ